MRYIVQMMNDREIYITAEEYSNLTGKSGLVYIPSQNITVNLNSVSLIIPEDKLIELKKLESRTVIID